MKYIQLNSVEPNRALIFLLYHLGFKSSLGENKKIYLWMVHIFNFFWLKYPHTYNIRHTVRRGQNNFCIQNNLKKVSIKNWENYKKKSWWSNKFLPTHQSDSLFCPPLSQSKLLVFDQNHSDWLPKNWINKQKKGSY